jgi:G-patch domain/FHA domain
MEEGEITTHDSNLEWPGADEINHPNDNLKALLPGGSSHTQPACTFRLLVRRTSILPKFQRLAVVDGYSEVQFGRDVAPPGSNTPRLRLKEMEVSKLHATAYWDKSRSEWALIDMGSKHGTFHATNSDDSSTSMPRGSRLSPPRVASMPRRLRHLDRFSIGSTTFVVHLHDDGLPCELCTLHEIEEIPLFDVNYKKKDVETRNRKRKTGDIGPPVNTGKDSKQALISLKRCLLSRHGLASSSKKQSAAETQTGWVDRSARRRAFHPSLHEPTSSRTASPAPHPPPQQATTSEVLPQNFVTPISATNIGHRMLEKQGWTPGTSLGQPSEGEESSHRVEPIAINANIGRSGLGSALIGTPDQNGTSWREYGKRKQWMRLEP